ncbi:MAG: galactonate dehydratase [Planctomycetota bacterium]|nr:galactonate dehydratase [Planctomycetota bacterium]MDA1140092.1 galactonate dehydratase [Planctomycetota bacterium]
MKITSIESILAPRGSRNLVFVKVHTDEGITGIGEAYSCGPELATVEVIRDFESWLIGDDPHNIEHIWQKLYNYTRFPFGPVNMAAISGIEHCLWDIKGKALGVPAWQLLGGKCRDKVRVYQSCGGNTPEQCAESALGLIEKYGYTCLKMGPYSGTTRVDVTGEWLRDAEQRMAAVRNAVGDDIDIGVDIHARLREPIRAIQTADVLKPYRPFFIEEPIRPDNIGAMAEVKQKMMVPLATGECLTTKFQFLDLLQQKAADIIQPDICLVGGMLECKKIAAIAEACCVSVAPHNPLGPVATAVSVHFAVSTPNFLVLEYIPDDSPDRRNLVDEPLIVENGFIPVPQKPGWGIELNDEYLQKEKGYRPWHRSFVTNEDGSVGFV